MKRTTGKLVPDDGVKTSRYFRTVSRELKRLSVIYIILRSCITPTHLYFISDYQKISDDKRLKDKHSRRDLTSR